MPVDANGTRADLVIYGGSTFNRTNFGRFFEHFINAAARDLVIRMRKDLGLDPHATPTKQQLLESTADAAKVDEMFNTLRRFYSTISVVMGEMTENHPDPTDHVKHVLRDGCYSVIPPDNPLDDLDVIRTLRDGEFCPLYKPITVYDDNNKAYPTAGPVLMGGLHILSLEKIALDWSANASSKVNHFGIPSKRSNFDKHTTPGSESSLRALGESETRPWVSNISPEATMELIDQSNNLDAHREVIKQYITHPTPSNIERIIDRNKIPFGGSKPPQIVNHVLACRGIKFKFIPGNAYWAG